MILVSLVSQQREYERDILRVSSDGFDEVDQTNGPSSDIEHDSGEPSGGQERWINR